MNIQQLRYVVAIANSGTFREAAEKMYVSQPSLSISVRDLEKELGFKIFRRTSSGTFLTRRGMEFYEKAQELVMDLTFFKITNRNRQTRLAYIHLFSSFTESTTIGNSHNIA